MDVTPLVGKDRKIIQSYAGGRFRVSGEVYETAIIVTPSSVEEWQIQPPLPSRERDGVRVKKDIHHPHPNPPPTGGGDKRVDVSSLREEDFSDLLARSDEIDVVLLGTGAKMSFIDHKLKTSLSNKGLVVDCMDTGAACRTYNVLMAEGRRVVAALLPV